MIINIKNIGIIVKVWAYNSCCMLKSEQVIKDVGSNPAAPVRMEENKTTDILCQNLIVVHWGQCDQMARSIAQNLAFQ